MNQRLGSTLDGEFLLSAPINGQQASLTLEPNSDYNIWGTVTHVIIDLYYPTKTMIALIDCNNLFSCEQAFYTSLM